MLDMIKNWKKSTVDINPIINKEIKIILIYALLSIVWIVFSDKAVYLIVKDAEFTNTVQTVKGLFFVLITGLFFAYNINRQNRIIRRWEENYKESEIKIKELTIDNKRSDLFKILAKYLTTDLYTSENIAIEIFRYIFRTIAISDQGSALRADEKYVTFLDAIGYDLEALNRLKMKSTEIDIPSFGIQTNKYAENQIERRLGKEKYEEYHLKADVIYESVYIGFLNSENIKLGISLDISEKAYAVHGKSFNHEHIKELKELQLLVSSTFRIKTLISMKNYIQRDLVNSFIGVLEYHDVYTKGHSESVSQIALQIALSLDLSSELMEELEWSSLVHDIGKIVIPNEILNKKGRLTEEEFEIVKTHSAVGESLLIKSDSLRAIGKLVRHHHERYDGNGYPDALKGEEIPFLSRIICVADAYHAMISNRPYRMGMSKEEAISEVILNRGSQFCPQVVDAFVSIHSGIRV